MGRLRAYFDQLAHPMQDVHSGTITRAYCRAIYEERPRGVLFFPLNRGKSGAAGKGGGERSEPISRMLFMLYNIECQSRNADFISIAPKGETTHYILRVASAPSKCVRCAPQSGNPPPSEPACQRQAEPSEPSEPGPLCGPIAIPQPSA